MAPRNKSKGFRPVWFVSGFGSWVGAQSSGAKENDKVEVADDSVVVAQRGFL